MVRHGQVFGSPAILYARTGSPRPQQSAQDPSLADNSKRPRELPSPKLDRHGRRPAELSAQKAGRPCRLAVPLPSGRRRSSMTSDHSAVCTTETTR